MGPADVPGLARPLGLQPRHGARLGPRPRRRLAGMAGQQIVVLGTYAPSLTGFRGDLIAAMIARGHRVTACAPDASPATVDGLRRLGADYRHVPFARNTLGPLADLATLKTLVRLFRSLRPQLVIAYTIKAVIYGSIAARLAGVPRAASMITGLGFAFGDGNEPRRRARGQKPRASYGKWAKPLTEGHGKTQCFRHFSVSLRPRS